MHPAKYMSAGLQRWAERIIFWLAVILAVILTSLFLGWEAIWLSSTIDFNRLVPISTNNILQALLLAASLYSLGIILTGWRRKPREGVALFTLAFALRVFTAVVLGFLFQFDDERVFHLAGIEQQYGLFSLDVGHGYYHLVNMLYAVFGPNLLLPKVVNAFLGSLLPFFTYDLAQRFFNDAKAAWRAFWFTAFLPPLVIFSAVNLKEVATAFLFVLTLWSLVVPRYRIRKIIGVVVLVVLLYWLRGAPWASIDVTGVITYFILGESWRLKDLLRSRSWLKIVFVMGLFAFIVSPFVIHPVTQMVLHRLTRDTSAIERFSASKAAVIQFVNVENPLAPKNLVILFLRGLFSPSPLRLLFSHNLDTILGSINMLVWYILFPFALIGFWIERRRGIVTACGVMALGVLAMVTMGTMVGSDPYRQRMDMFGMLFILASGGFTRERRQTHIRLLYIWLIGIILFTGVWLFFKI